VTTNGAPDDERRLALRDSHWGGWKNPECEVWAGALNHADLDALLARIGGLNQYAPPPNDADDE
jgi:hypothetical protein